MSRFSSKTTTVYAESLDGAVSHRIGPGPGDISIDNFEHNNVEVINVTDRGDHEGLVEGAELLQSVSMTVGLPSKTITDEETHRALDMINGTGIWADIQSADPDVYAVVLRVVFVRKGVKAEIRLPKFRGRAGLNTAMEGSSLAITGTNYKKPKVLNLS